MSHPEQIVVRWHRGWSIFMILCSLVVGALALTMALAAWPDRKILFAFTVVLTLIMAAGVRKGIKMYKSPPVMFTADREKIDIHLYQNRYREQGYEIPWSEIVDLELVERSGVGAASDRVKKVTIALHLAPGHHPPDEICVYRGRDPQTVHLDANTGTIRGQELLTDLQRLQQESRA